MSGQIVTMTYPLIGNYGVNPKFDQAKSFVTCGFITAECAPNPATGAKATIVCYLEERRHSTVRCRHPGRDPQDPFAWCDAGTDRPGRKRDTAQVVAEIATHTTPDLVAEVTTPEIFQFPMRVRRRMWW